MLSPKPDQTRLVTHTLFVSFLQPYTAQIPSPSLSFVLFPFSLQLILAALNQCSLRLSPPIFPLFPIVPPIHHSLPFHPSNLFPLSWRHSLQTSLILPFPLPFPFSLSAFAIPHPTCHCQEPHLHTLLFVAISMMKMIIFTVITMIKTKMILLVVISVTNIKTIPFVIISMTKTETTTEPFSRFVFH